METDLLNDFLALAKYKNYSTAADQVYISQSTLSKRIKKLENQLGVPLFDRTTKSVELNEYGEIFETYARKILALETECLQTLQETLPEDNNSLTIGAIPSLAKYHLTDLISKFIQESTIRVHVLTAPSEKLEEYLKEGKCDAAFIRQVQDPDNIFIKREITKDQLVVVLPKTHPLAAEKRLEMKQLKQESFVLLPEKSRPYETCVYLCKKSGFSPSIVFTDSKVSNIIDFISKGMGVSLLMSKNISEAQLKEVVSIPVYPNVEQSVEMCVLKSKRKAPLQKLLLNFIDNLNV